MAAKIRLMRHEKTVSIVNAGTGKIVGAHLRLVVAFTGKRIGSVVETNMPDSFPVGYRSRSWAADSFVPC